MNEHVYTNYCLLLPDQEVLGTLVVRDGHIAEIQPGLVGQGQDGQGAYLMPGLVELHTDNLEQCITPRPKVRFPLEAATIYHDRELASAGITTVCDAIALGDITPDSLRLTQFGPMIAAIEQGQQQGQLAIDHRLHLRCELAYAEVCDLTERYADHPLLALISLMDHTPGQRQYARVEKYREYYMGKHHLNEAAMDNFIQARIAAQHTYAAANRQRLVELAQAQNVALASHDDATIEHIQQAVQEGAAIAEFPTTLEAAKEAHRQGLQILMGAPNLVLGGSHSGNISAQELVELDMVDIISSDYVPQSLLMAMFLMARCRGEPLYKAMQAFTLNPARAIGLESDRGSLEVGKRADLLTVSAEGPVPRITAVFREGFRIA